MRINVKTKVKKSRKYVWDHFDEKLFKALNPPFPPVKVKRFDGSRSGDEVHLQLDFLLFKNDWVSTITEHQEGETETYFIDQGTQLPFFLKSWRHKHRIVQEGDGAVIIDEIEFETPFPLFDYLMYPLMMLQFVYRKPVYQNYFS